MTVHFFVDLLDETVKAEKVNFVNEEKFEKRKMKKIRPSSFISSKELWCT